MARRVEKLGEGKNMLGRISNFFLHNNLFRYNYPRIPNETGANKKVRLITSLPSRKRKSLASTNHRVQFRWNSATQNIFRDCLFRFRNPGMVEYAQVCCPSLPMHFFIFLYFVCFEAEKNEISRQTWDFKCGQRMHRLPRHFRHLFREAGPKKWNGWLSRERRRCCRFRFVLLSLPNCIRGLT